MTRRIAASSSQRVLALGAVLITAALLLLGLAGTGHSVNGNIASTGNTKPSFDGGNYGDFGTTEGANFADNTTLAWFT